MKVPGTSRGSRGHGLCSQSSRFTLEVMVNTKRATWAPGRQGIRHAARTGILLRKRQGLFPPSLDLPPMLQACPASGLWDRLPLPETLFPAILHANSLNPSCLCSDVTSSGNPHASQCKMSVCLLPSVLRIPCTLLYSPFFRSTDPLACCVARSCLLRGGRARALETGCLGLSCGFTTCYSCGFGWII